ncbi:hypothetical protein PK21_gp75 [Geobacillus phage vB_GthS_PK2.1]|nr:hypothetical protein PK21_gp75 [Geobacillus phage vB_GthS_PK2.1]
MNVARRSRKRSKRKGGCRMGGKPSKGTPKDMRLKRNRKAAGLPVGPGSRSKKTTSKRK